MLKPHLITVFVTIAKNAGKNDGGFRRWKTQNHGFQHLRTFHFCMIWYPPCLGSLHICGHGTALRGVATAALQPRQRLVPGRAGCHGAQQDVDAGGVQRNLAVAVDDGSSPHGKRRVVEWKTLPKRLIIFGRSSWHMVKGTGKDEIDHRGYEIDAR